MENELPVLHTLRVRGFASPEQIAESSGLDLATIRSVLDGTAAQGHTRHREGRISGHSLTPAGRAHLDRVEAFVEVQDKEFRSMFTEDEAATLARLLTRIRDRFTEEADVDNTAG